MLYVLGFCNSVVSTMMLKILSPTMNTQVGDVGKLPIIVSEKYRGDIERYVSSSIDNSIEDWNSSEIAWDFKKNPLI